MLAKYCKNKGCSENKGEPCALADHCWLFQWDVSEKNVAVGLVNDTADKSDGKEKETQRGATHAVKRQFKELSHPLKRTNSVILRNGWIVRAFCGRISRTKERRAFRYYLRWRGRA